MLKSIIFRPIYCLILLVPLFFTVNGNSNSQTTDLLSDQFPRQEAEEWIRIQANPDISPELKVISTVDTYFKLKYSSLLNQTLLDDSFLFDPQNNMAQKCSVYEMKLTRLVIVAWDLHGVRLKSFNYLPKYYGISIKGHSATISMWPNASIVHADTPERTDSSPWTMHFLTLSWSNGYWYIIDDQTDDEWHLIYPQGTDLLKEIMSLPDKIHKYLDEDKALTEELKLNPKTSSRFIKKTEQSAAIPMAFKGYRRFDNYRCSYYASIYSSNEPGSDTYNPLFMDFSPTDCQNFVSQCIWYGYGGVNESVSIESHDLPMIDDDVSATTWWCDSSGAGIWKTTRYCWNRVADFHWMVTNNYIYSKVGLQAMVGSLGAISVGDYIKFRTTSHVYIISRIVDWDLDNTVDYNEIYICSHTTNHRDSRLVDLVPDPRYIYYMWNMGFRNPDS